MYKCENCDDVVLPGNREFRAVTHKRLRKYPSRKDANPRASSDRNRKGNIPKDDPGGEGWETARELRVCEACHGKLNGRLTPEEMAWEAAWWNAHKVEIGRAIREVGFEAAVDRVHPPARRSA